MPNDTTNNQPVSEERFKKLESLLKIGDRRAIFDASHVEAPTNDDGSLAIEEKLADEYLSVYLARVSEAANAADVPVLMYPGENLPDGYHYVVQMVTAEFAVVGQDKKKQLPTSVVVWVVPSFETALADKQGRDTLENWYFQNVTTNCIVKVVRGAADLAAAINELPTNLSQFLAASGREGLIGVYNELAPDMLKMLKAEKLPNGQPNPYRRFDSIKKMDKSMLRNAMENKAYASAMFATLENGGFFVKMLDQFERTAIHYSMAPDIFKVWRNTRDDQTFTTVDETVDISDVAALFAPATAAAE